MKRNYVVIAGIVIVVIIGAGVALSNILSNGTNSDSQNQQANVNASVSLEQTQPMSVDTNLSTSFTKEEVATRNSRNDCWTIIDGIVYDITSYITRHPGGDNILSACGTDGTEYFYGQRAGASGGRENHRSNRQATSELARLRKGSLAQ